MEARSIQKDAISVLGWIGLIWGVGGVLFLLVSAVVRLLPIALEPFSNGDASMGMIAGYVASVLFMGYTEGYKAFQKQFSPRVVVRGLYLARKPELLSVALAPLFCMSHIRANKKRLITSWAVTIGVIVLIIIVRAAPQPYRGAIDAGVVVGLSWGAIAIIVYSLRSMVGNEPSIAHDVNE